MSHRNQSPTITPQFTESEVQNPTVDNKALCARPPLPSVTVPPAPLPRPHYSGHRGALPMPPPRPTNPLEPPL